METQMETETKKKQSVLPVIIAASAVVLLVSIVVVMVFFSNGDRKLRKQLDQGYRYLNGEDFENATLAYRDALRVDPENKEVLDLFHESYLRWMEHDREQADEILDKEINTLNAVLAEAPSQRVEELLMNTVPKFKAGKALKDLVNGNKK